MEDFKTSKLQIAFLWILIIIITTVIVFVGLYYTVLRRGNILLSIKSLYEQDIVVTIDDERIEMKMFDVYAKSYLGEKHKISVYDKENNLKKEYIIDNTEIDDKLVQISLADVNNTCYFSADVTNYYQGDASKLFTVNLTIESNEIYNYTLDRNSKFSYVYPGNSTLAELGDEEDKTRLKGIYPIECTYIDNEDRKLQTVKLWSNYDPRSQRDYYQQIESDQSL